MSDRSCHDCMLDSKRHDELAQVLRAGELDVFARADLAADAIDLAEAEARVGAPRFALTRPVLAAAAVLVGFGLWVLLSIGAPEHRVDDVTVSVGSVEAERAANIAFLDDPDTKARIAKVKDGRWIGIQHGKTMVVADSLGELSVALKRAESGVDDVEALRPRARHRFTFQKGREGDKEYKTYFSRPPFVGADFINHFELGFAAGGSTIQYLRDGRSFEVEHVQDKGAQMPMHLGEPTTMGGVEVVAGFSTGSVAPLVLPTGMGFPRFEIPGKATLAGGSDHPGTFRRYMASVSIPKLDILEAFVEAIGNDTTFEQEDGSLLMEGHVWRPDSNELREEAHALGKPVLLLERERWLQRFPGNPFAGLQANGLRAALPHYVLAWRERPAKSQWVGGGFDAPPAESRLTVVDPRATNKVVRQLVVRSWTPPVHVATLLSAGLREYEAEPRRANDMAANEGMAIRVLMSIRASQVGFGGGGHVDADGDGAGEFGTLAEMTGAEAGRMAKPLRPPLLPNSFKPDPKTQDLVLGGYRFRLFFPGAKGTATRHPAKDSSNLDVDKSELHWWAYAWPEQLGVTGRRTFYVDESGDIWGTERWAGAYEGTTAPPPPDAAFAEPNRYPGGVSPALVSADGHRWKMMQ